MCRPRLVWVPTEFSMNRLLSSMLLVLAVTPLVAILAHLPALPQSVAAEPTRSPLVQRRVFLDPRQPDFETWRAQQGTLLQMPRDEFEAMLDRAEKARQAKSSPIRLLETTYRARLVEPAKLGAKERLVAEPSLVGTGEWKLQVPTLDNPFLPIAPFSLAVKQARFENRDGHIGDVDGVPMLWLDRAGDQTLALDWSARGDEAPDGYHFDWQVPSSPVALLELEIPRGRTLSVSPEGCIVRGPFPTESDGQSLWKIRFGGRTQLHLIVSRPPAAPGKDTSAVLLVKQVQERFTLRPGGVQAEYILQVQRLDRPMQELILLPDPDLQPYQVTAEGLQRWERLPAKENQPAQIRLDWSEATSQLVTVRVLALAPLGKLKSRGLARPGLDSSTAWEGRSWSPPTLRVVSAIPREEALELRCHPELHLQEWLPGAYRIHEKRIDLNGFHRISLRGEGIPGEPANKSGAPSATRARPTVTLLQRGALYHVRQTGWWQIQPRQNVLTVQVEYDVQQGRLHELPLIVPSDWEIEQVDATPRDVVRTWSVRTAPPELLSPGMDKNRALLLVELQKPLQGAGDLGSEPRTAPLLLTVELRGRSVPGVRGPWTAAFPDLIALGAQTVESNLGIEYDEDLSVPTFQNAPAPATAPESSLWGMRTPDIYFTQRGAAVPGRLRLAPRGVQFSALTFSDVRFAPEHSRVELRLEIEALSGIVETVDLQSSAPLPGAWRWHFEGTTPAWLGSSQPQMERRSVADALVRLGTLNTSQPLGTTVMWMAQGQVEHWRLRLPAPLPVGERLRLLARFDLPVTPTDGALEIPVLSVSGSNRSESEVRIHPVGALPKRIEYQGLQLVPRGRTLVSPNQPWQTYRQTDGSARLRLVGRAEPSEASAQGVVPAWIDQALLLSTVERSGTIKHTLTFRVFNWDKSVLPIRLPAGCVALAAQVQGREISTLGTSAGEPVEVLVPVPMADVHAITLAYSESQSSWTLGTSIKTERPQLPLEPLRFSRRWYLPRSTVPLSTARLQPVSEAGREETTWLDWGFRPLRNESAMNADVSTETIIDGQLRLRNLLSRGEGTLSLGEVLDALTSEALPEVALLVDRTALRQAGLTARSTVARPTPSGQDPLEAMGLTLLPVGKLLLVTTQRQRDSWFRHGIVGHTPDAGLQATLTTAQLEGQDPLGRFARLADWLRIEATAETHIPLLAWPLVNNAGDDGLLWEEVALQDESILVVRTDLPWYLGAIFALVLLGGWMILSRMGREVWRSNEEVPSVNGKLPTPVRSRRRLVWLASVGICALLALWIPVPLRPVALVPLATGCLLGVFHLLRATRRIPTPRVRIELHQRAPSTTSAQPIASAALLLAAFLGMGVLAQGPSKPASNPTLASTIYILPGPGDAPEKQTVLIAPALKEQLLEAVKPVKVPARALIVKSNYPARIVQGSLWVDAEYQIFCTDAVTVPLPLPLDGATLRDDMMLDGARAYPQALPRPQTGYSLKVGSAGMHKLVVPLVIPIQATNDGQHEVRFDVPRTLNSRFTLLNVPDSVESFQSITKCGPQVLTEIESKQAIQVDLGPVQPVAPEKAARSAVPVQFRWRQDQGPVVQSPTIKYKEAYIWDFSREGHRLRGVIEYQIGPGATRALALEVPAELQVVSVEARRPATSKAVPVRLRQWRIVPAGKTGELILDFQGPVSDAVEVILGFIPATTLEENPIRGPRQRQPVVIQLPLPEPRGQLSGDASSFLGYRLNGLRGQSFNPLRVTGMDVRDFPTFPSQALGEQLTLDYAAKLSREPGKPSQLRLRLDSPATTVTARQQVVYQIEPHHVDMRLTAEIAAPTAELSLLEWDLPQGVVLTQVSGPIASWSQTANRLQVWLSQSSDKAEIRMNGYVVAPATTPWGTLPRDVGRWLSGFQPQAGYFSPGYALLAAPAGYLLGAPTPRHTKSCQTTVNVTSSPTKQVQVTSNPDWQPGAKIVGSVQLQSVRVTPPGPFLVLLQPSPPPRLQVLRVVEKTASALRYAINFQGVAPGSVLDVEITGLSGSEVVWEITGATRKRETSLGGGVRRFRLEAHGRLLLSSGIQLSARVPLDAAAEQVAIPQVRVLGEVHQQDSLALIGLTWAAPKLRPVNALTAWSSESERVRRAGGTLWQLDAANPSPRVLPVEPSAVREQVTVLRQEHRLIQREGESWLHESRFVVANQESLVWWVALPAGSRLAGLWTDDGANAERMFHRRASGDGQRVEIGVPLVGEPRVRRIRITWLTASDSADRPDVQVAIPLYSTIGDVGSLQLVLSPLTAINRPESRGPAPLAHEYLEQAESQAAGCKLLLHDATLSDAQKQTWLRGQQRLELSLSLTERLTASGQMDPQEQERLRERTVDLRRQMDQHAREHNLLPALQKLRREVADVLLGRQAQPTPDMQEDLQALAAPAPSLDRTVRVEASLDREPPVLTSQITYGRRTRLWGSALIVVVALGLGVFSRRPQIAEWLHRIWPELVAIAGLIAWVFWGWCPVVVFLGVLAVSGRLLLVFAWLQAIQRRREAEPLVSAASAPDKEVEEGLSAG